MTLQEDHVVEASTRQEFNGVEDVVNAWQFRLVTGAPLTEEQGADEILEILEILYEILQTFITTVTIYRDVRMLNQTDDILMGIHNWPTLIAGENSNGPVPPGVAGMINLSTVVPNVTLRKYFGVFAETSLGSDGTWDSGQITALGDVATALLAPLEATNSIWEYGYTSPKTLGWVAPISASLTDVPAYQRRRKQGRGS